MQAKIVQTADGSSSVYIPKFDELYHSVNGAISESAHVFIETGLKQINKPKINIFEMGYGTGLNFILSFLQAKNKNIEYHAIEAYPLDIDIIEQLNYPELLKLSDEETNQFYNFHFTKSSKVITKDFSLTKTICKLSEYSPNVLFDLIYFDAFGPEAQPELWTQNIFEKLFDMMNPKGILTTYCAKGAIRRTMQSSGFKVERLPGPPGKREMLRARKP